jgi:hypothetical protein
VKGYVAVKAFYEGSWHYSGVLENGMLDIAWDVLMEVFAGEIDAGVKTHAVVHFGDDSTPFDSAQTGIVGSTFANGSWTTAVHDSTADVDLLTADAVDVDSWEAFKNTGAKFDGTGSTDVLMTRPPHTVVCWARRDGWGGAPGGVIREAILNLEYPTSQVKPISRIALNSFPIPIASSNIELLWWYNFGWL